jgi:eukaryotic-like serine/threonine-protein kinase
MPAVDTIAQLNTSLAGRYTVEREIGQGGMATVFLARDLRHDRQVALKLLKNELGAVLGAERFLSEIKVTANLQHPNILPLFDSGEASGHLFYVMPFVEGESLRARLDREKQLSLDDAIRIAIGVASALDYAHRHAVIHRDLKPENILLHEGQPLVADFGIALAVSIAGGARVTQTGLSLGTPQYMPPEQAAGDRDVDGRADVYALGCVLYEMLAGEPPFGGPTAQAVVAKHLAAPFPHVRHSRPDVPEAIDDALRRAAAKAPADRYPTTAAFAAALSVIVEPAATGLSAQRNVPGIRSRRLQYGLIGVVALVILGIVGFGPLRAWMERLRVASRAPAATGTGKSVAVLPLASLGGDTANAYFADGMTDALITALAKVPGLRVTPRASAFALKGAKLTTRQVGDTLHVATVLEGSVQRVGNQIRIVVALTDPARDSTLWSETYDGAWDDVFAMQDSISRSVVGALRVRLGHDAAAGSQLVKRATKSAEAYDFYLQGRYLLNTGRPANVDKSLDLFNKALQKDSSFALAYAGIADAYVTLAFLRAPRDAYPRAETAANQALALDSTLAEANLTHAMIRLLFHWDLKGADRAFRRALELGPSLPQAHSQYSWYLVATSQVSAAIVEADVGRALDPLSVDATLFPMLVALYTGDHDRLIAAAKHALELDSTNLRASELLGYAYASKGQRGEALAALSNNGCNAMVFNCALSAIARLRLGDRAAADRGIREAISATKTQYVPPDYIAWFYATLGDKEAAFAWLEKAYAARSPTLLMLKIFPGYAPLRDDPRFAALIKKVGLQ